MIENIFNVLNKINLNQITEKRNTGGKELSYLSWSDAITTVSSIFNNNEFLYTVYENKDGGFNFGDGKIGYFVKTSVTILGVIKHMQLPVLDGNNNSLKDEPYTYSTKYGNKPVVAIDSFAINSSIQRCLVKNLAMFGLGLYIYRGEDLPYQEPIKIEPVPTDYVDKLRILYTSSIGKNGFSETAKERFKSLLDNPTSISEKTYNSLIAYLTPILGKELIDEITTTNAL